VEILAQSSAVFALTLAYNFQGTHILGASRGHHSDSVISLYSKLCYFSSKCTKMHLAAGLRPDSLQRAKALSTLETTVADFGDCHRKRRLSPKSTTQCGQAIREIDHL